MVKRGQVGRDKGRSASIRFEEKTGEDYFELSSLEKNRSWGLCRVPIGCKQWLVHCLGGQSAVFLSSLKSRR